MLPLVTSTIHLFTRPYLILSRSSIFIAQLLHDI